MMKTIVLATLLLLGMSVPAMATVNLDNFITLADVDSNKCSTEVEVKDYVLANAVDSSVVVEAEGLVLFTSPHAPTDLQVNFVDGCAVGFTLLEKTADLT